MAPHLVWLVQNDFLPFAYAERARRAVARADRSRPASAAFVVSQIVLPAAGAADRRAAALAAAAAPPSSRSRRRPTPTTAASSRCSRSGRRRRCSRCRVERPRHHRDVGLSALAVPRPVDRDTARRALDAAAARARHRDLGASSSPSSPSSSSSTTRCCRSIDHRYRAVFFPGDELGAELTQRYRAVDRPAARYVIGTHVGRRQRRALSPDQPRVLIDGEPRARAMDRSRRSARARRAGGVDRRRSDASCRSHYRDDRAATPRSSRRSRLPICAAAASHGRLGDPAAAAGVREP